MRTIGELRDAVADQRCAVSAGAPLRVAGSQFLGFEVHDFRWLRPLLRVAMYTVASAIP